jgi:hypothetical protein
LEAEIDQRGKDSKPVKSRKVRAARVPEHLPAVDEVIESEKVTAAPEAWRATGEEITEQLDYQPERFFRRRIIRKKYVKRDEPHRAPIIAPLKMGSKALAKRCQNPDPITTPSRGHHSLTSRNPGRRAGSTSQSQGVATCRATPWAAPSTTR